MNFGRNERYEYGVKKCLLPLLLDDKYRISCFFKFHKEKCEKLTDLCDTSTVWAEISPFKT